MHPINLAFKRYLLPLNGLLTIVLSSFAIGFFAQPTFQNIGPNQTISCGTPLPELNDVNATSNCEGSVDVSSFIFESGNIIEQCNVSTAFGPGADWSVWLPLLDAPSVAWNFIGDQQLTFYANGTGHLSGTIQNGSNTALQMSVDMRFENGRNWQTWSALGRGYKNDIGLAGNNFLNWTYYELNPVFSRLSGLGSLAGSELILTHLPSNYYYGFQTGVAANNKNSNNGISGWFAYSGTYNDESVSGNGDLNLDRSCSTVEHNCGSSAFTAEYRAEDSCGAVAYATRVITVVDDANPVIDAFESPLFVACTELINVSITAADACSDVTILYSDVFEQEGCSGLLTRTYNVIDGCGNASTAEQQIYLVQEGALQFITFPADTTLSCENMGELNPFLEYSQVCFNTQLTFSDEMVSGNCPANYSLVRTYTLTDACGNTASSVWTINFIDQVAPVISDVPGDLALVCGDELPAAEPTAVDNCSAFTIESSETTEVLSCASAVITIWTVTDACGNSSSAQRTITLTDNSAPAFTYIPASVTLNCGESFELDVAQVDDDCSQVNLTWADEPLNDCAGSYIRVWRALDGCGNQALESSVVTFVDTESPVLAGIPESASGSCGSATFDAEVTATDNCDSAPVVTVDVVTVPNGCGSVATYTWTATDACGNTSSSTSFYTLTDNVAPVFDAFEDSVYVVCGNTSSLVNIPALGATDACSEVTAITFADNEIDTPCGSLIERTYTAVDGCGNSSEAVQVIVFQDFTAPVFVSLPQSALTSCEAANPNEDLPLVEDDCSSVTISYTDEMITSEGCSGSVLRVWMATDACGNTATQEQVLTYSDNIPPTIISLPSDITASCDQVPDINLSDIMFEDNCSDVTVTTQENFVPGYCSGGYNMERIWTLTDACGNTASATQTVYVVDEVGPIIIGVPADTSIICGADLPLSATTAIDNCTAEVDIEFSVEEQVVADGCNSYILRIYSASDACGNTTSAVQQINLIDDAAPLFVSVPEDAVVNCGEEPLLNDALAIDACSNATVTEERIIQEDCSGSFIRVFTATDACGNSAQATQTITIIDAVSPEFISFPLDSSISCSDVEPVEQVAFDYSDNCSNVNVQWTEDILQGDCPNSYTTVRTCTLTDACGNSAVASYTLMVSDYERPQISGVPADMFLNCGEDLPVAEVIVTDNCTVQPVLTLFVGMETIGCTTYVTRRWTAVDECGNVAQDVQVITYIDEALPVLSQYPDDLILVCGSEVPSPPTLTAYDDCSGEVSVSYTEYVNPDSPCAPIERTWCAADCSGNEVCFTQLVFFEQSQGASMVDQPILRAWQNSTDEMMVTFTANSSGRWGVDVYDLNGRKVTNVFVGELKVGESRALQFDVNAMISGFYIFKFSNGNETAVQRLPIIR